MSYENEPTGFHLIMLLKSDVSCSSDHPSVASLSLPKSSFIGVGGSSSTASPAGVDAALEGWRTFLLGGMVRRIRATEDVAQQLSNPLMSLGNAAGGLCTKSVKYFTYV